MALLSCQMPNLALDFANLYIEIFRGTPMLYNQRVGFTTFAKHLDSTAADFHLEFWTLISVVCCLGSSCFP